MSRWLFRWSSWAIDRPRLAILLVVLLTLAAAPGLLRLELRTDGHALVPPNDPAVLFDEEVRREFHLRDPVVVLIESPVSVYNPGTMRRLKGLTEALARLDGVGPDNVVSLATERRDRVYPGTLVFRPLLDPLPHNPLLLRLLREDVEAISLLTGTLVSADGRAVAVLVGAPPGPTWDRTSFYKDVLAASAPFARDGDRVSVVGAPVAEALLGTHVQEDLSLLLPLSVALISGIIALGCRRAWGVALGLSEVGGCLVWTFGIMGWAGVPVSLTTSLLPVILATVGVADDIHLLWRYQRVLARISPEEPHPAAVRRTMSDMVRPIALTSVTTLIGFLSFNSSQIEPVRAFGTFAGVGMVYCIFYSLTALPAALALLPPERLSNPRLAEGGGDGARLLPLVRRPRATLAALLLVSVAVGAGAWRLRVQDGWIDGFAPGSGFRRDTDRANRLLNGTHILLAHLTVDWPEERVPHLSRRSGPLLDGRVVAAIGGFESFLAGRPRVGGVLGPYNQLATVNYLWHARKPGWRTVPSGGDSPRTIDRLLIFFDRVRGEVRRREVIHDDLRRTVVTVFLKDANYRDTRELMEAAREYSRRNLEPLGIRLGFAGDVAVSQAMIPAIVRTQVVSLLLALAGSFLAVCVLYRSLRTGLLAILPPSLAALWMFGVMGWLGTPLGVATSMFFAITLGIGVDYAIHFLERADGAPAGEDPALWALREAGPAITADAFAIALGFGLFLLSQVPANARLGGLVCVALLASWLLTLAGLGSLLRSSARAPS
ncbi:MAG: MMPL family transporter [Acidobacteriota bacterium]